MYDERIAFRRPREHRRYPYSFLAPIAENEPWLSSALAKVAATIRARHGCRRIAGAHRSLWLLPGRLSVFGIRRSASCALWGGDCIHRWPYRTTGREPIPCGRSRGNACAFLDSFRGASTAAGEAAAELGDVDNPARARLEFPQRE